MTETRELDKLDTLKKGKLNESDALKGFDKLNYHKLFIRTPKKAMRKVSVK